jgi:PAS domain S-box-containing protein
MNNTPEDKNRRVLIIDDNRSIHDDFRKILSPATTTAAALDATETAVFGEPADAVQQTSFEVDSADQGQEGVLLVKKALEAGRPYAMAFVDVRMPPGLDGVETTRKIWELDPDLQVVLCTAYSDYSWGEMFEKLGHHDGLLILKKPFDAVEAFQLAHALTEKWWLHQQAQKKMDKLESMIAERTGELQWKTAFLEAQLNSSIDGILVVDQQGKKAIQNHRVADLFKIPPTIADGADDAAQVRWVTSMIKNPESFAEQVVHLYAHPEEISRDEIELKNGTILDRYSAPVVGKDGTNYGRIWTFRDVTGRRRVEQELKEAKVAAVLHEGAQRYNFLADTVPLIIWTARPDGGLDYYNKAWFDYTGLTLAQTADWGWGAVLHPDDLQRCIDRWTHSFTTGENYEIEYRFKRASDGTYRWFLGRASARRNEAGEIMQWVGTGTDIDDQKRARSELENRVLERTAELAKAYETLQQQQAELRVLFNLLPAMIWFKDTENRILRVNQRVAETAGKSVEEIEGKQSLEIYPQEAARFYADDLEVIHSGAPKLGFIETLRDQEGKEFWVQTDKVPYCDKDGKVIGIVVMAQDITERKRTEDSLRLLGSAVEQTKESIMITDAELNLPGPKILFVNPAFTKMTGYNEEEAIGKTPRILQGPHTDRIVLNRLRENLERGKVFEGEAINYRKDGTEFSLEWQIAPLRNASGKITHFVAIQRDITERKKAENALRESNEKFQQLVDNITDVFWIRSPDMREMLYLSPAFEQIWGRPVASLHANPQQWADFIVPEDRERVRSAFAALTGDAHSLEIEYRIMRPDSEIRWVRVRGFQVRDNADKLISLTGTITDITERRQLEAQLFQSQKLETVGKLAGGIAHEFNSILTAIIGQTELLIGDLPAGSPLVRNATEINKAANRAATLTRQLLAYGRKQLLQPENLDLNQLLANLEGVFHNLMGDEVNVQIVLAPGLQAVKADAGQLEQVIMNMLINARDAMPNGGKLTMETANVKFDKESVGFYPELKPGNYVMLAITDTGAGMSEAVKSRAFEPFFSTKGVGEGTGLGLSTSYGIVKQSGGHISIYSELGRGTTFKIYLPQVKSQTKVPISRLDSPDLPHGTETILLAEDDPALREMAATLLRRLGYTVFAAANGVEALSLTHTPDTGPIDLLFTDVVMPHISGQELADRVRALYPHMKVLFTSAYTENAIVHQGVLDKDVALLQKPFTPSALARKLREVLDQPDTTKPYPAQETFGFTKISD